MKRNFGRRRFLKLSAITTAVATTSMGTVSLQNVQAAPVTTYSPPSSNRIDTLADNTGTGDAIAEHTNTVGYNRYYGWYTGSYNDLAGFLNSAHAVSPASFAMSEYGAGASIYQHQENPSEPVAGGYFHPEEYQAKLHEVSWQALANMPSVWGKFIWNMFDFASSTRDEGDHAGRNDKGLCTYDRVTCKATLYGP